MRSRALTDLSQVTAACPVYPKGVQTYRPSQLPDNSGWPPILIIPQALRVRPGGVRHTVLEAPARGRQRASSLELAGCQHLASAPAG